jgi:glycosyltransferase involved in cell wall biosynthesis
MTDPGPPLVTVVVPVHNGERYLTESLDSIRR